MSLQDNDISWHVLRRIVHDWAGSAAELSEVKPLAGGCINTTLALTTTGGDRAVLKIACHRVNREFEREAHQLKVLSQFGLPTPRVYQVHTASLDRPDSFLLMEFIDGVDFGQARQACSADEHDDLQSQLAEMLLALHSHVGESYSRVMPEESPCFESWPRFYRHVYDTIWADVEKSNILPVKPRKLISKIHEKLDRLLVHDDRPRLVHWDIWATNLLAHKNSDGKWRIAAILDPNCKFAHIEAEIAYMELFHTVNHTFMKTYQRDGRLPDGYHQVRKWIYQLYPLINHVHLFGNEYVKPLMTVLDKAGGLV